MPSPGSKENHPPPRDAPADLVQPATKRRRLEPSTAVNSKPSFVEVLEALRKDDKGPRGAEGGADQWERPKVEYFYPETDHLIFQQIDIQESQTSKGSPMLKMYGVTREGHSVLAHVKDFLPYFYVLIPRGLQVEDLPSLQEHLNHKIGVPGAVVKIEALKKKTLYGYVGDDEVPFIKITISHQRNLPKVRGLFEQGDVQFQDLFENQTQTYESNINYVLRFMIDTKVVGMNWIEVPAGKYHLRSEKEQDSHCQLEVDMAFDAFISHPAEGEWSEMAPLRVLSFDIECAGRKGVFPDASQDPVIQIANMVTKQGEDKPFIRNVFTLDTCANIVGSQVISHKKEADMLEAWSQFLVKVDADVIIGYNIGNFDFPYLMDRATALKVSKFPFLGKLKNVRSEVKNTHFSSKAYGTRDSKETHIEGRLQLDMLQVMQRDYKLRSYSLNAVCAHFLGEQKEDVHHSVITDLQKGSAESRRRLAVYCLKDAYLPQRLMDKLLCLVNYTEMSRVTGVPFNYLLSKGQSIKVISQLYRKANAVGYLIPALKGEGTDDQYEGATVIEPEKGFYKIPIATLDFSSLYPSIMMAHNLCYTTLVSTEIIKKLDLVENQDYIQTPNNDFFITASRRKGLLPIILEDLIAARKRAKADLKVETNPFKRAVLDGRQLALKISANSVYGFTGATVGKLPCLAISSSTTAYGRQMIERTKTAVESEYSIANGKKWDARVIYGDTDSVMVQFGCPDLETAMALGSEAAAIVTSEFPKPIKLEFEKVYFPYLLISKKRYAGLYWTRPDKYDKMDAKGIETVRRDNCRLVSTVISTCLNKLLIDRDTEAAEKYAKGMIADLLQNKIDMSQLVITKALSKEQYEGKQAHDELAKRMRKRDAGSAPALGDRVAYVIIKGAKSAAAYEKAEDPLYVLENNVPIDTKYYLDNQLAKPLTRIFEPILGSRVSSLLTGDHTRTIQIATPSVGGLMKFAVKQATCLGCKTVLKASNSEPNGAVCNNCRSRVGELYQKQVAQTSRAQVSFARLWTQCQRCQGSLHMDVLCTSKDCPIFYMRKKAQKDVADAVGVLERFDEELW